MWRVQVRNADVTSSMVTSRRYLDTRADEFASMPTEGWEAVKICRQSHRRATQSRSDAERRPRRPQGREHYFAADGTPQLYDFQYCGKACPAKGVAYCLCCGSSAWDAADELARGYHRDLSAALASQDDEPPPGVDAFLETLELAYATSPLDERLGLVGQRPRAPHLSTHCTASTAAQPSRRRRSMERPARREFPV